MDYQTLPVLSLLIWTPILGGLLVLYAGDKQKQVVKSFSLTISILVFLLSTLLYVRFDTSTPLMQFVEYDGWIETFNINYHLGVDGISVPLILLTTFTTVLVVIAGWEVIKTRLSQYMASFLILEGLMNGVFASLDAILFYFFWEAMLIPMFLIIGVWGGPKRVYARSSFFFIPSWGRYSCWWPCCTCTRKWVVFISSTCTSYRCHSARRNGYLSLSCSPLQ